LRNLNKLDANETIAPRIPVFCPSNEPPGASADPIRARGQTLVCACDLLGCHRAFEREKEWPAAPKAGSALHPSVTASSVKKALMGLQQLTLADVPDRTRQVMLPAHTQAKSRQTPPM
jgi:hypothetical protein